MRKRREAKAKRRPSPPSKRRWRRNCPKARWPPPTDGSIPEGYEIKGNANSMKYHVPGGRYYDVTIADVFFDTAEHAEAAGYDAPAADTEQTGQDDN